MAVCTDGLHHCKYNFHWNVYYFMPIYISYLYTYEFVNAICITITVVILSEILNQVEFPRETFHGSRADHILAASNCWTTESFC